MHKICFLSTGLYNYFFQTDAKTFGGVSRIYRLVRAFARKKKYRVVCLEGGSSKHETVFIDNITMVRSPVDQAIRVLDVYRSICRLRPDLLIDFYASARVAMLGAIKKINKIPFIFFVGADTDVNGGHSRLTNPLFYHLYVWGLKKADKIICQTSRQIEMLKQTYGLDGQLVLSPYLSPSSPQGCDKKTILWVGRSTVYKRPEHFIALAKKIPGETFVLICNKGRGDHKRWQWLEQKAGRIPNLRFIEAVPHDRMQRYYAEAKLLVNTSEFEGFANTFIEAAMQKVPILSLNVDSNGMLTQHGSGICCEGNFEKLTAVCRSLAKDTVMSTKLGCQARAYALKYHDINDAVAKIENIFDDVLQRKRGGPSR